MPNALSCLPLHLQSIKSYFPNDDDFNWNFGIAKAAVGKYKEAEETLSMIQNEKYRQVCHGNTATPLSFGVWDVSHATVLVGACPASWCLPSSTDLVLHVLMLVLVLNSRTIALVGFQEYCYLSWMARCYIMNGRARLAWELYLRMETSEESYQLLQLIANDCYKMGSFFYAAKAFDVLERLDPAPEYLEGKKGACIGTFQVRALATAY